MPSKLARARLVLFEVPTTAKLAYCLVRDGRVPLAPKVALGAAVGLAAGPRRLRSWMPVVGEMDVLALGVLAVKVFVDACPEPVVKGHRAAVGKGDSVFDQDLRATLLLARDSVAHLLSSPSARNGGRSRDPGRARAAPTEDESA